MLKEKPELSDAMRKKLSGKSYVRNPINGTKFTIAISSAKGGVGKSTFATNIAIALKKIGCKVGLLDADIYGPSLPKLFSINEKPKSDGKTLNPILKYDIQCMSIGFLTEEQTPMIWRGPMVISAIKTLTEKVSPVYCEARKWTEVQSTGISRNTAIMGCRVRAAPFVTAITKCSSILRTEPFSSLI